MAGCVIAIDGPAASGKSSVSRGVAAALGWFFVSSGHFYRAIAWGAVRDKVSSNSPDSLVGWVATRKLTLLENEDASKGLSLLLDGENATPHLSDPQVAATVSVIAAVPAVRDFINARLRALSENHDLVMEGRDIGSIVFPETPWKFYLDASPEVRARRRASEGAIDTVTERDRLDSTRATAPLMIPLGAIVIDTTHLNLDQVIQTVLDHLHLPELTTG
ncbi:MAG: (d)CMP kinase [Verrucomicrobiota bacterium]